MRVFFPDLSSVLGEETEVRGEWLLGHPRGQRALATTHTVHEARQVKVMSPVFCPGFQKGRVPSEKGTFSAVSGPSKGHN